MEVEYDADEAKYDVSFKAGGYEYDYEVDAYTGAIIKAEKESDD
ncbi:MAG: PepSY domain-containing protein [Firmicutes bacterium]|nr:PepSY domain-containing protein [Bacillota bacterium]